MKVRHPNTFIFLEKLQRVAVTEYNVAEALNSGRKIRRPKAKSYLLSDTGIKRCTQRLINDQYDSFQFLRAASDYCGSYLPSANELEIAIDIEVDEIPEIINDDENNNEDAILAMQPNEPINQPLEETNQQNILPNTLPVNLCDVCLVRARCARAFVPCGHARFCYDCIGQLLMRDNRCPFCRTEVVQVLQLF